MLHRRYGDGKDLNALAQQVKSQAAKLDRPIGHGINFRQPLQFPRQLVGLKNFVGRMDTLWDIHDALTRSAAPMLTGEMRSVVQLCGFGGVGKSMLAEEYALRFGSAYPGGIFWLNALGNDSKSPSESETLRLNQIASIASALNIPTQSSNPEQLRSALGELLAKGRRCLWIVDDLPAGLSQEEAERWISPHASVPTLITTRDTALASLGIIINLDVLSTDEAMLLLGHHISIDETQRTAAKELVDELGCHPLALQVAGAYLKARHGMAIPEFLTAIRSPRKDILEQAAKFAGALPLDHSASIVATLANSIALLSEPARDLLCLASHLASAPIPPELITSVLRKLMHLDPEDADDARVNAVYETDRYGVSRPEKSRREAIAVHPLVARTAQRHPLSAQRLANIRVAAVASLNETLETVYTSGAVLRLNWEILHARKLASTLDSVAAAQLLVLVANLDLLRGDQQSAQDGSERAIQFCSEMLGPEATEAHQAMAGRAAIALSRGDTIEAAAIYDKIWPVLQKTLPLENRTRIGIQTGLIVVQFLRGNKQAATDRALLSLSEIEGVSSRMDESLLLGVRHQFYQLFTILGCSEPAATLNAQIQEAESKLPGCGAFDILLDKFLSAQLNVSGKNIDTWAAVAEEAARVFAEKLGEDAILTLQAKLALLNVLGIRDDPGTLPLARDLLSRSERILGPNNPATLEARHALARALTVNGEAGPAVQILDSCLPVYTAILGPNHKNIATMTISLGQALYQAQNFTRALQVAQQVLTAKGSALDLDVINGLDLGANCLFRLQRRQEELAVRQRILPLKIQTFGDQSDWTLSSYVQLAWALWATGQSQQAEDMLRKTIFDAESALGHDSKVVLSAREALDIMTAKHSKTPST